MATKFYFKSTGAAAVTPPTPGAEWEHQQNLQNLPMSTSLGSTALATVQDLADAADHTAADQDAVSMAFVSSEQFAAQTITAQTITAQFQCFQPNTNCNQQLAIKIYAVSGDGATARSPAILSIWRRGVAMNAASIRNQTLNTTSTEVTISDGDRIVVEIGSGGNPTAGSGVNGHNNNVRVGESAANGDLPVDETQTGTGYRPWLNFANTLTAYTPSTAVIPIFMAQYRQRWN